jgi:hypothetical protein
MAFVCLPLPVLEKRTKNGNALSTGLAMERHCREKSWVFDGYQGQAMAVQGTQSAHRWARRRHNEHTEVIKKSPQTRVPKVGVELKDEATKAMPTVELAPASLGECLQERPQTPCSFNRS